MILIVDDNPASLLLLDGMLGAAGYPRAMRSTADDGLEAARDTIPDLILLDMRLPSATGHEVLGQLRASPQTRDIPVIAVTASAVPRARSAYLEAGFADLVCKPVAMTSLLDAVSRCIGPPADAPCRGGGPPKAPPSPPGWTWMSHERVQASLG